MDVLRRKSVLIPLGIFLVLAVAVPVWILPAALAAWAKRVVARSCEGCSLEIDGAHFWLFPPSFRVESARLVTGKGTATEVRVDTGEVTARLYLYALARRRFHVESIAVTSPKVAIIDRAEAPKAKESPPSADQPTAKDERPWRYQVGAADVRDARFSYERHAFGKVAKISFDEVHAKSKPFAVQEDGVTPLMAEAEARLEKSGKVHVVVGVLSLAKPLKVEVDAAVANQKLEAVNRYFFPDSGIDLKGHLIEGKGHVSVQDHQLQSSVEAAYDGLDVTVHKNIERTGFVAALMNFVADIKLREKKHRPNGHAAKKPSIAATRAQ